MEILIANFTGAVRRETLHGREHLVAPLTMIVPGVLEGSKGALYYPPDEIGKNPSIWNHIPITLGHPIKNGQQVSAREPDALEKQGIGLILRTTVKNGKLIAEGWFDVERTRQVDSRTLDALQSGRKIELSTGLFTENEPAPPGATFNGEPYQFIARNYRPDHLAILLDQVGACSIQDGCGVMVNCVPAVDRFDILPTTADLAALEQEPTGERPEVFYEGTGEGVLPLARIDWAAVTSNRLRKQRGHKAGPQPDVTAEPSLKNNVLPLPTIDWAAEAKVRRRK